MGIIRKFFRFRSDFDPLPAMATELLFKIDPKADLHERTLWLGRLLHWIKDDRAEGRSARLRYLFQLIEKDPVGKARVGATLRSVLRDASALGLYLDIGIALDAGLWTEIGHRLLSRLLPRLAENDLLEIIHFSQWDESDADWLASLSSDFFAPLKDLLHPEAEERDPAFSLEQSAREALIYLASSASHFGLSKEVRRRHALDSVETSPFLQLQILVLGWAKAPGSVPQDRESLRAWDSALGLCRQALRAVYQDMEKSGVSVGLVYRLEVINHSLQRMDDLLPLLAPAAFPEIVPHATTAKLIRTVRDRGGIREHLRDHMYLLSRKIAERNGHSGEHYLATQQSELISLFASGAGGGIIVVFMSAAKILLHHQGLPPLPEAFLAWAIYSLGFIAMQMTGLTLATKLPSFLAAHLARKLAAGNVLAQEDEIGRDIRGSFASQLVAFLGNLAGVIPFCLLLTWLLNRAGLQFFTPEQGLEVISEVHPFRSLAIPLGALTGVELWLSSLAGGWFENWLVFHRVPEAIKQHSRLRKILGPKETESISDMVQRHSSGIGANIALGFLFGFVPLLGLFLNLNTASRHVTIASTNTMLGFASLKSEQFGGSMIAVALIGLLSIGLMNFLVSFYLALSVAVRASGAKRAWVGYFFNPFRKRTAAKAA
jgi:site-specific recombinase